MAGKNTPRDEKFEKQDFDLFAAIDAIDKKNYDYFDSLTPEQQKKFVPFMMLHWMSAVKGNHDIQGYYLRSMDYNANKYMFNENVQKHPKLQWLMLCAGSPGIGKQYHQWIPNIPASVSKLKAPIKAKDIKDYYAKVYPKADGDTLKELSEVFVANHKRKMYLAEVFPNLKVEDIETLNQLVTDDDIKEYERERGNS